MADEDRRFYGLQFHPEVTHTAQGRQIIERFVHEICGCGREWTPDRIIDSAIQDIRQKVGSDNVLWGYRAEWTRLSRSTASSCYRRAIDLRVC